MEFEHVEDIMPENITCNLVAAWEHVDVGENERAICVIKEQGRSAVTTLAFNKYPHCVIIDLVYSMVLWRNSIPAWKKGISAIYSSREIITGMKMDFKKHCQLDFGEYVEVHDEPTPTVALAPTDNLQGTYKFMDTNTDMKLKKRLWTCITMPDAVIGKITQHDEYEKHEGGCRVGNRNNKKIDSNDGLEETTSPTQLEPDAHPYIPAELPGVELEREQATDALDTIDPDTDPTMMMGAI